MPETIDPASHETGPAIPRAEIYAFFNELADSVNLRAGVLQATVEGNPDHLHTEAGIEELHKIEGQRELLAIIAGRFSLYTVSQALERSRLDLLDED
jgi:hypothetical protein